MAQLIAKDIMTSDPLTAPPDMTVKEAARTMVDHKIGALLVVENDALIGLVSEGDLIMQDVKVEFPSYIHLLDGFIFYPPATQRFEKELKKAVAAYVSDVMTKDPVTVTPEASVEDVATLMVDKEISHIPVVDGKRPVGIISKYDIVRSLAAED